MLNSLKETFVDFVNDISLAAVDTSWFQMNGAPDHNTYAVRNWFNSNYSNRWIGRNGTALLPARSHDLTPLDFFLWSFVKGYVCNTS